MNGIIDTSVFKENSRKRWWPKSYIEKIEIGFFEGTSKKSKAAIAGGDSGGPKLIDCEVAGVAHGVFSPKDVEKDASGNTIVKDDHGNRVFEAGADNNGNTIYNDANGNRVFNVTSFATGANHFEGQEYTHADVTFAGSPNTGQQWLIKAAAQTGAYLCGISGNDPILCPDYMRSRPVLNPGIDAGENEFICSVGNERSLDEIEQNLNNPVKRFTPAADKFLVDFQETQKNQFVMQVTVAPELARQDLTICHELDPAMCSKILIPAKRKSTLKDGRVVWTSIFNTGKDDFKTFNISISTDDALKSFIAFELTDKTI